MGGYTMQRGGIAEVSGWVMDQYHKREDARVAPKISYAVPDDDPLPAFDPPVRSLSRLRMGRAAFREAQATHRDFSLWAVDYCDGIGPRLRCGPLIAEPADDLPDWDVEVL